MKCMGSYKISVTHSTQISNLKGFCSRVSKRIQLKKYKNYIGKCKRLSIAGYKVWRRLFLIMLIIKNLKYYRLKWPPCRTKLGSWNLLCKEEAVFTISKKHIKLMPIDYLLGINKWLKSIINFWMELRFKSIFNQEQCCKAYRNQ